MSYNQNQGKGYAVRQGMLAATGDYAFFFDADMSTPLEQIEKFLPHMENHIDVIIGTRKNGESTVIRHQPVYREWIGKCFTILARFILQIDVTDFSCGFKAFSKSARLTVFPCSIVNGWGFDAEILFLTKIMGLTLAEKAVTWTNDVNTKVNLVRAIPQTLQDLIRIHWTYTIKRYSFQLSRSPLPVDQIPLSQFGKLSSHLNPHSGEQKEYHLLGGELLHPSPFPTTVEVDRWGGFRSCL